MKEFIRKLTYNKPAIVFIAIMTTMIILTSLYKGEVQVDEEGNIASEIMNLHYKYSEKWERVPTEISQTLYIKNEKGENELLITLYSYPLQIVNATEENAYEEIEKLYTDAYETTYGEPIEIDGVRADLINYYSKAENYGGRIYVLVHNNVGYTIMFTESMSEFKEIENPIIEEFLANVYLN